MTQTTHTEERAEFEKLWVERPIYMGQDHQKELALHWWQAARRAPVVPKGYEHGMLTGNRVILDFDTQENADAWFDSFCDYCDAAAHQPPEVDSLMSEILTSKPEALPAFQKEAVAAPVQVPRFNHAAKRKLELLTGDGATVTGYAFQKADGRRGSIDCGGFVAWWPSAFQTEVGEVAPVQLPEPVYTMRVRGPMHDYTPTLSAFDLIDGEHRLYTEQQVRQLLAEQEARK